MGTIWKFSLNNGVVDQGGQPRRQLTSSGCNEPYKGRYWCPRKKWFRTSRCPFTNRRECQNYEVMCGSL